MRILIVDDEARFAEALAAGLRRFGHEVRTVYRSHDAFLLLLKERGQLDLLILDLLMPGMRGYDLCRQLRDLQFEFPVLVLTAVADSEVKTEVLEAGANDYLEKPFSFSELRSRIDTLMGVPV